MSAKKKAKKAAKKTPRRKSKPRTVRIRIKHEEVTEGRIFCKLLQTEELKDKERYCSEHAKRVMEDIEQRMRNWKHWKAYFKSLFNSSASLWAASEAENEPLYRFHSHMLLGLALEVGFKAIGLKFNKREPKSDVKIWDGRIHSYWEGHNLTSIAKCLVFHDAFEWKDEEAESEILDRFSSAMTGLGRYPAQKVWDLEVSIEEGGPGAYFTVRETDELDHYWQAEEIAERIMNKLRE